MINKESKEKNVLKNSFHLYLITVIKMVVPLAVMPYLVRVLNSNQYAAYSYVRACITFVNLIMDYGFLYSATKDIAEITDNKKQINSIIGQVTKAKLLLAVIVVFGMIVLSENNVYLSKYKVFTVFTVISAIILNLLPDYLFRGIEKMGFLSIRMLISRALTTGLLFVLVKGEKDFNIVAYLELACAIIALVLTIPYIYKNGYSVKLGKNEQAFKCLKDGFYYFVISVAPSLYGALNTLVIGNSLPDKDVIYWSTSWSVITAVLTMYNPIIHALFPHMVKKHDFKLWGKLFKLGIGIVLFGQICMIAISRFIFLVMAGRDYVNGGVTLQILSPIVLFGFIAMMLGTPFLGAIGKQKELSISTILTASFHIMGLVLLTVLNHFTIVSVCIMRVLTEIFGVLLRSWIAYRNRESILH